MTIPAASLSDAVDFLYEDAPCGYLVTRVDGGIVAANRTIAGWLGTGADTLVDRHLQDLLTPGAGIFYETRFLPTLELQGFVREVAFDLRRADGSALPALVNAVRRPGTGPHDVVTWITFFDATHRRRYEDDLLAAQRAAEASAAQLRAFNETLEARVEDAVDERLQAEEMLRQAQKMEAIGQLTGGIAHDFNNLLAGITGSLELLKLRMDQGRTGDVDRYIMAAQGAAKRAASLTHRLLAFARQQTLDAKPTDVNRLVQGLEDLVRRTAGAGITLEIVGAGGLWTTFVDGHQLENAVLNLCINARDAMPGGGRLTVETSNKWMDQEAAAARDLPPGQYVALCVTDTGSGMSPEIIQRAFDPFFTTKPLGEGTGLGLSMVYGFARQSNGQVRIYSEVGRGTTVCIYLPRHFGEHEAAVESLTESWSAGEQGDMCVLVVEDEPTVRTMIAEVLKESGYHAIEAASGAAGLAVLTSNARVDLLLTDVGLPGSMNGRQLADHARELRPSLPVLFVTGYAENAVLGSGKLGTGLSVLTKPFSIATLARRLNEILG